MLRAIERTGVPPLDIDWAAYKAAWGDYFGGTTGKTIRGSSARQGAISSSTWLDRWSYDNVSGGTGREYYRWSNEYQTNVRKEGYYYNRGGGGYSSWWVADAEYHQQREMELWQQYWRSASYPLMEDMMESAGQEMVQDEVAYLAEFGDLNEMLSEVQFRRQMEFA